MQTELLNKILEQTTKTNGRVTACETWIAAHAAQTSANIKALEALTSLVAQHEALANKMVGVWIAACGMAAVVGTVAGVVATYFSSR